MTESATGVGDLHYTDLMTIGIVVKAAPEDVIQLLLGGSPWLLHHLARKQGVMM